MLMSQRSLGILFGNALVSTVVAMGFALLIVPPLLRLIGVWRKPVRQGM